MQQVTLQDNKLLFNNLFDNFNYHLLQHHYTIYDKQYNYYIHIDINNIIFVCPGLLFVLNTQQVTIYQSKDESIKYIALLQQQISNCDLQDLITDFSELLINQYDNNIYEITQENNVITIHKNAKQLLTISCKITGYITVQILQHLVINTLLHLFPSITYIDNTLSRCYYTQQDKENDLVSFNIIEFTRNIKSEIKYITENSNIVYIQRAILYYQQFKLALYPNTLYVFRKEKIRYKIPLQLDNNCFNMLYFYLQQLIIKYSVLQQLIK